MKEETMMKAPRPEPFPAPVPPSTPAGQAVAVEFMDGRVRRYLVQALTLDSETLTMTTPAGTVAIPARQVRETVLQIGRASCRERV